ncbi:hypothetical protein [Laribacter hongkongensis]|uniref:hypothetical protein n=1 Tax=Laribacter hongkongensis TaxID=168471 RepID=UPI001B7F8F29|nr:hypothetical protein [Laribacter hongkongensis]
MKRSSLARVFVCWLMSVFLWGCSENTAKEKVGISFGVGEAKRWPYEMEMMKGHAKELGLEVDARLNKNEKEKSQKSDCEDLELLFWLLCQEILTMHQVFWIWHIPGT